jgi:hypothetical protein
MWKSLHDLDRLLRGEVTRLPALQQGKIDIDVRNLVLALVVLGGLYGSCMGWFSVINRPTAEYRQLLASAVKVPLLFFLTLVVTFPSLYVFNALVGSQLSVGPLLRLLVASLGITLAVLASFGTIVAFFSLTTENYFFMVLLNVAIFAVAGLLGLVFLLQTLNRLQWASEAAAAPPATEGSSEHSPPAVRSALERAPGLAMGRNVRVVFRCWIVVFALVGGQMSWVLRPFIGWPQEPFAWFRPRQSNFFEAVWHSILGLFR